LCTVTPLLEIGLVQLIIAQAPQAIGPAQALLSVLNSRPFPLLLQSAIVELIEIVVIYKFPQLSREEIEQMLGLSELKQTRVYQEALQEGRQEEGGSLVLRLFLTLF
jgi:predicted transposase YdaD